jgi:uncharacterized protein (TIGR04222 family)
MHTDILCPDSILTTFTDTEYQTYDRLNDYRFDRPDAALPFSQRLAKENHWSRDYTDRAIREYKRFAFLAVVAGHPVSPSDQVDQVWHLHLTYTRSYWQEFCDAILAMPLHHEPTQGGGAERAKHRDWYRATLESYDRIFGEAAPADLWPPTAVRFGPASQFARLNTQQNWILPKPQWVQDFSLAQLRPSLPSLHPRALVMVGLCLGLSSVMVGCQGSLNPLDISGPDFLGFYIWLNCIVVGMALMLRRMLQPRQPSAMSLSELDLYETAYLSGGTDRVVQVAITQLAAQDCVELKTTGTIALKNELPHPTHAIERAVARAIGKTGNLGSIKRHVESSMPPLRDRLIQANLIVPASQTQKIQRYPALLMGASLGLGLIRLVVGIAHQRPVGYLIILCAIVALIAAAFATLQPRRMTAAGDRLLQQLRQGVNSSLSDLPVPELVMAVALVGSAGLVNTSYGNWHRYFVPLTIGDSGSNGGGYVSDSGGYTSDSSYTSDSGGGSDGGGGGSSCGSGCGGGGCGG